jgi:hypothetical protein
VNYAIKLLIFLAKKIPEAEDFLEKLGGEGERFLSAALLRWPGAARCNSIQPTPQAKGVIAGSLLILCWAIIGLAVL